ncbi:MAG: DUF58 domain-containing protein [Proteobacteria bacterium]|nr:DUF58 domain-containing protein [Pseudomonadota bacterium]
MNFARFNHVLVPQTKDKRDQLRSSKGAKVIYKSLGWLLNLSDEGRVAIVLWLIIGAISLNVGTTQFYFLWSAITGLLVGSIIFSNRFRLDGVQLRVEVPRRTMTDEEVAFSLTLRNMGVSIHQAIRIRAPFLPWDGAYCSTTPIIEQLAPGEIHHTTCKARFVARGEHHLDVFEVNALVPLGLGAGPSVESTGVRFLVVPRIAPVTKLTTPLIHRYQPGGVALASRTGESRELTGIRPYRPGDPIRDLHAGSWARTGQPVVREYQQEYFTRIGIVVDTSQESATEAQFEAGLSLAAGLVSHLSRGEALIDLLVIGDDVHQLALGRSLGFLDQALDLLACVKPATTLSPTTLEARLNPYLDQLSCVVFITLGWDESRARFRDWVTSSGVGCRVLEVANQHDTARADEHLTRLTVAEINGDRDLLL